MNGFLIIFIFFALTACSGDDGLGVGYRAGGFLASSPEEKKKIAAALKEKKIPFEFQENDMIFYLLKNQAEVLGLIREIRYKGVINPHAIESSVIINDSVKDKYELAFKKRGIPYNMENINGILQISWRQNYGSQVDLIRQNINLQVAKEATKKGIDKLEKQSKSGLDKDLLSE